jgi:Protein of unknown function (DUF2398)
LLICAVIRQKVSSNVFPLPPLHGCLLVAKGELDEIFRQTREKYERNWGNTAQKTSSFELMRDVYAKMRLAGLLRGPDRNGNVLIMPTVARYAVSYSREDETEKITPTVAVQAGLPDMPTAPPKTVKPPNTKTTPPITPTANQNGYTTTEFARLSGLTQNAVFIRVKRGTLKAEKRGQNWYVLAEELERLKADHSAVPAKPTAPVKSTQTAPANQKGYTTGEFARLLGVVNQAVLDRIKRGTLKAEKRGLNWFIPAQEWERIKQERGN